MKIRAAEEGWGGGGGSLGLEIQAGGKGGVY